MILFILANLVWPLLIVLPFVLIKAKPWMRIVCTLVVVLFAASCGQLLSLRESNYRAFEHNNWISDILLQLADVPEPQRKETIIQVAEGFKKGPITQDGQKRIESIIGSANKTQEGIGEELAKPSF